MTEITIDEIPRGDAGRAWVCAGSRSDALRYASPGSVRPT